MQLSLYGHFLPIVFPLAYHPGVLMYSLKISLLSPDIHQPLSTVEATFLVSFACQPQQISNVAGWGYMLGKTLANTATVSSPYYLGYFIDF